jgi:hypothetical protein
MISRKAPRAWGFAVLFVLGASLTAPVGLGAQDKTKDKEKPKDPVGKVDGKAEPKAKSSSVEIPLDLKEMYTYEIEVVCVETPVTLNLSVPLTKQNMSSWGQKDSPKGPTTFGSKIKTFIGAKEGGKYTLTLGTADEKKPLVDYTLTIKATVSR